MQTQDKKEIKCKQSKIKNSEIFSEISKTFLIVLQTAVYIAERFIIHWNFSDLKNPRFIIQSGFKSRAGYNGARTVIDYNIFL